MLVHNHDQMLYYLFQLESYAWKKPKADKMFRQTSGPNDTGVTLGAYKGLDFKLTMEVLSMVRHGKRNSLRYQELIEETETELGVIALRMIQTAIGAWGFSRRTKYALRTLKVYKSDKAKRQAFNDAREKFEKVLKDAGGIEGGGVEELHKLALAEPGIDRFAIDKAMDQRKRLIEVLVNKLFDAKVRIPFSFSHLPTIVLAFLQTKLQ